MAGVTFLAFGNGSPDVFSTFAAMSSNSGSLAVGELIGAAGFITAVVAGSMALVREFRVGKKTFVRDVGFFIVAASFSLVFLADGALYFWECIVMVAFYIFYVVVVVVWHWYLRQQRIRRDRETAARGHYLSATNVIIQVPEEDDSDDEAPSTEGRYRDVEDFDALERGGSPLIPHQADDGSDDGDEGIHLAAEMASSMRVTRPSGTRRNTITPIRPSLVGALEFRSVLSSLQKSRGSYHSIHLRRYSGDAGRILSYHAPTPDPHHNGQLSVPPVEGWSEAPSIDTSNISVTPGPGSKDPSEPGPSTRARAVSMNDAAYREFPDPAAFSVATVPNVGVIAATPTFTRNQAEVPPSDPIPSTQTTPAPISGSPKISVSPPLPSRILKDVTPASPKTRVKRDSLAPPEEDFPGAKHVRLDLIGQPTNIPDDSRHDPSSRSRTLQRPRLEIPKSTSRDSSQSRVISPVTQFPAFTDSPLPMSAITSRAPSLMLPEAVTSSTSLIHREDMDYETKPVKWWPYAWFPSPQTVASTLFPTLITWQEKSIWDKFVSVISAPSIFLLAITLPVVESESKDDGIPEPAIEHSAIHERSQSTSMPLLSPESPELEDEPEWLRYRRATESQSYPHLAPQTRYSSGHSSRRATLLTDTRDDALNQLPSSSTHLAVEHGPGSPLDAPTDWNRWLIAVQIFTAPLFVTVIIWANRARGDGRLLVKMILYSSLASLITLAILLLTTSPTKPPKYRFLLCFLGFVVSIAWISTIANEVVGVLKALGVILEISDAILGLTIFAVGNSLGDLVADITVARLGYPVMALSACFGGPMLNILLGIGLSGLYMTITQAKNKHAQHPDKEINYKPYKVEVSGTLMVSGVTLLVTLIGLLIAVPLNKWVMSRRIGWGLIALWSVSTAVNVAVEVSGIWADVA